MRNHPSAKVSVWQRKAYAMETLLRTPYTEVPTAMKHAHHIKHTVVVALLSRWNRRIPQCIDEGFRDRPFRSGKARSRCCGHHPGRVALRERFAIQRVLVAEGIN